MKSCSIRCIHGKHSLSEVAAGIVCLGMLGYVFGFTQPGAAGPALLFMFIVIPILAGAGWKEFNLLSRRLSALK